MTSQNTKPKAGWLHKTSHKVMALTTATIIALGGALGAQSFADSKTAAHMKVFAESSGGWSGGMSHRAGMRDGRHGRHGDFFKMSDAEIDKKLTRAVKHIAIEIDATQEQQDKIISLVTAAVKEVKPIRETLLNTRTQVHELLLAETINRGALEALRAERLADSDRISKTLVNTVAEIAEVLTAEQRKQLDELRSKRKRWHRG